MLAAMSPEAEPVFERRDGLLVPTRQARGPWGDTIGGRNLSGLVAYAVELEHGDDDYQPARLTVDMFRPVPATGGLQVKTAMVRRGYRIRVIDASLCDENGLELLRGTLVQLRRGQAPSGTVWSPPEWRGPAPESLPPFRHPENGLSWDMRRTEREAWVRELRPFVGGEMLTPFVRAALAADSANGTANSSEHGLGYINADLSMYLTRLPEGEWIGVEATGHGSDRGVAIGTTSLYDSTGRIGHVALCAVADSRLLGPP